MIASEDALVCPGCGETVTTDPSIDWRAVCDERGDYTIMRAPDRLTLHHCRRT